MANYDFTSSLSPLDFEILSKDLLEAELGIRLEILLCRLEGFSVGYLLFWINGLRGDDMSAKDKVTAVGCYNTTGDEERESFL